jgi:tight adherence protein C
VGGSGAIFKQHFDEGAVMLLYLIVVTAFVVSALAGYMSYVSMQKRKNIDKILSVLKENKTDILLQGAEHGKKTEEFKWKLAKAGINKNEYEQVKYLAWGIGVFLLLFPWYFVSLKMSAPIAGLGAFIALFFPNLYLDSLKNERAKRIDSSLSAFLDLVIIILEAGGGLNNALKEVSVRCKEILSQDLLAEIGILQTELSTYSSEVAYNNLIKRTGSKPLANFVHFLKLAEETGIGVKTIFESQSKEIKDAEFFEIEKKAAVTNLYLTMIVFMFILPALGAFIVFPMMADALMPPMVK